MHKRKLLFLFLISSAFLSGCSITADSISVETEADSSNATASSENETVSVSSETGTASSSNPQIDSDLFTDRDFEVGFDESTSAFVNFQADTISSSSDAVQISGSTVTLTDEGTYILSGTLDNGMVIIDADDTDKIQLVLNGVSISNDTSAAVYIREADKVFITTASGSENMLSNAGEYIAIDENNIDSVIFSKSDLTLNGSGSLIIDASAGHGIVSKDDLTITSGMYQITSENHALSGKDSICIANGTFSLSSGKDGIHSENEEDTSLGFLYIADGTFNITSEGDCLSAENSLQIENGTYTLVAVGGSANATQSSNSFIASSSSDDTISTKGIKASGDLILNGGTFSIDSADDSIHSNANLSINGGSFQIASGDDAVHADSELTVSGGTIEITESYEGLEGLTIHILDGEIHLVSSDDGLNAAGGNDQSGFEGFGGQRGADRFSSDPNASINIEGGILSIVASGDGIDSNGSLIVSGGEIYISGPENSGNGSLDYASDAVISGGIFVAAGSSGMASNFGSSSTQGVIMATVSAQSGGSSIILSDSEGNELVSWISETSFDCVIISCPEITEGSSYLLTTGSDETQITMDSLIYTTGGQFGQGQFGGGRSGFKR